MTQQTISEALRDAAERLSVTSETPRLDAEVLLRHLLGINRTALFTRLRDPFPESIREPFERLIQQRLEDIPVAYLTGEREFMGHAFVVGPGVLVPRPETELMVEWAAKWLSGKSGAIAIDVGTGSGAIGISVALASGARAIGIEPSSEAIRYAIRNRDRLAPIELIRGNLADPIRGPVDLVLANLPYLRPDQVIGNANLRAEPVSALVSGSDGLDLIRALIADLLRILARDGAAILEIDPSQSATVEELLKASLPDAETGVIADLAGLHRFVFADRSRL
jgi:release factor glutamine methyltransferase